MSGTDRAYMHFTPEAIIDMDLDPDTKEQIGYVILKNISDSPVGYKFRSSNKDDVTVQPATGVLGAAEDKQVTVSYLNWHPDHSQHEKLQVLVTPLDDMYHADQNLRELFKRATDFDVQEHLLQIQSGAPRIQTGPQERKSSSVAPKTTRSPTPIVIPTRKPTPIVKTVEIPPKTTTLHRNYTPAYRPQNSVTEEPEIYYRPGTWDRGHGPHFTVNYPEESLPEKIRKRSQSFIGCFKDLPIIHDLMMSDYSWRRFLFALILLVALIVVLGLVIRTGIHYRHRKSFVEGVSMFGESAISTTATVVAELGESFLEDKKKMTLDEFIHWRMT